MMMFFIIKKNCNREEEGERGFKIPKGKRVRIFNGGKNELVLIEILKPAYDLKRVKQFNSFD